MRRVRLLFVLLTVRSSLMVESTFSSLFSSPVQNASDEDG
jgi:hypothetical protein